MKQAEKSLQTNGGAQTIRHGEDMKTTARPPDKRLRSGRDNLSAFKSKPIVLEALGNNPEEDDSRYWAVCRGWD